MNDSLSVGAEARRVGYSLGACRRRAIRGCGASLSFEGRWVNSMSRLLAGYTSGSAEAAEADR